MKMGHAWGEEGGGWEEGWDGGKVSRCRLDGMLIRVGMVGATITKHGIYLVT